MTTVTAGGPADGGAVRVDPPSPGSPAALTRRERLAFEAGALALDLLMRLLAATWRIDSADGGLERLEAVRTGGRPVVLAFWHDRLFGLSHLIRARLVRRGHPIAVLISLSKDGELGTRFGRRLGGTVARGSASRGGSAGLRRLRREIAAGATAVMVLDGPRGPRHEAKPGAAMLARLSGAPLVPLTFAADRAWHLGSWDRLAVPKPFARLAVAVGDPIEVPSDLPAGGVAEPTRRLEAELERLGETALRAVGRTDIT